MKNLILIAFIAMVLLSGCNENKAKNKAYYLDHIELAKKKVKTCKESGYSTENEKLDCSNAQIAVNEIISKSNNPIIGDEKVIGW